MKRTTAVMAIVIAALVIISIPILLNLYLNQARSSNIVLCRQPFSIAEQEVSSSRNIPHSLGGPGGSHSYISRGDSYTNANQHYNVRHIEGALEVAVAVSEDRKQIRVKNIGEYDLGPLTLTVTDYRPLAQVGASYMRTVIILKGNFCAFFQDMKLGPGEIWKVPVTKCYLRPEVFLVNNKQNSELWYGLHESIESREASGVPQYWK